jgi:hypothetical protein
MKKRVLLIAVLASWLATKNPAYLNIVSGENNSIAVKINQITKVGLQHLFHAKRETVKFEAFHIETVIPQLIIGAAKFSYRTTKQLSVNDLLPEIRLPIITL